MNDNGGGCKMTLMSMCSVDGQEDVVPDECCNVFQLPVRGRSGAVERWPLTKVDRIRSLVKSLPDFRTWESCWMMSLVDWLSLESLIFPAFAFERCSMFTSFQEPNAKSCSNLSTPLKHQVDDHLRLFLHWTQITPDIAVIWKNVLFTMRVLTLYTCPDIATPDNGRKGYACLARPSPTQWLLTGLLLITPSFLLIVHIPCPESNINTVLVPRHLHSHPCSAVIPMPEVGLKLRTHKLASRKPPALQRRHKWLLFVVLTGVVILVILICLGVFWKKHERFDSGGLKQCLPTNHEHWAQGQLNAGAAGAATPDTSPICVTSTGLLAESGVLRIPKVSRMLANLDPSVDPCEDFYQFACGGFLSNVTIPDDEVEVSMLTSIEDRVERQLREVLEEPIMSGELRSFQLAKDFYKTCLDKGKSSPANKWFWSCAKGKLVQIP
ncbi:hypothetical protein PR048_003014 [Dryococelus australis]|uniref:Peptidase M13 N-terminal domain-containing protein n=1 Tax=Dryococelus australis TaxID=614101 RepID=A0ABQ9ILW6_9NEOP|nr:hypothetical protein PR048_003014 [Dryococelus australis]